VNTATVNAPAPDPAPADNTATVQTTVHRGVTICDFNGDGRAEIVVGVGRRDGGPHVRILSLSAAGDLVELVSFAAYFDQFPGGVFVACGDVTGDGYPEVVTGADIGGDAHVEAFQIAPGTFQPTRLASFYANEPPAFVGGVRVAIGDVDGDGMGDIVTGAGASDGPIVKVFSLAGGLHEIAGFDAYTPSFNGGVFVASCDMNNDGRAEIITGVGRRDGGPHVRVLSLAGGAVTELVSFQAYFDQFPGGVFVACGDLTGDGINEIVTGADVGGDAHARDFTMVSGALTAGSSFYAYPPPDFPGGVRVAAGDVDGDGVADIITGLGTAGPPLVRVIRRSPNGGVTEMFSFYPYPATFNGGVYVASGSGR
jgi:hypothetical protein